MKDRKKLRSPILVWLNRYWFVPLSILVLLGLSGYYGVRQGWIKFGATQQTANTSVQYHTTFVKRGNIRISVTGVGSSMASRTVDLSFSTKGPLADLKVALGDIVQANQELARLGSVESLEASVASSELAYLQAQQALDEIQKNGDVALAEAYQAYVTAKETYEKALYTQQKTANYARCSQEQNTKYNLALENATKKLNDIGIHSYGTDGWINARNVYDTALANYTYCIGYTDTEKVDAKAALDVAAATYKEKDSTYNTLKSASGIDPQKLALAQAKVDDAKTALATAKKNLANATLVAPVAGKVTTISKGVGSIVDTSTFITLSDISRIRLDVSVSETDLSKLVLNSAAEVVFDALPDNTYKGTIITISPTLTSSGNSKYAKAVVELDEASSKQLEKYPLGMNASVDLISKETTNALVVPVEALRTIDNNQYGVFVVEDGKIRLRTVQIGLKDSTQVEILSGLSDGDIVSTGKLSTSK